MHQHGIRHLWKLIILAHCLAIAETYLLVVTGLDWYYFMATRHPLVQAILFPAALIGGILPFTVPIILYLKDQKTHATTLALAGIMGWAVSSTYKVFTGRAHPDLFALSPLHNSSDFQFGFFRGGVFCGWPSSHTTVAFAMSVALIYCFPQQRWLRYWAIAYATYIGLGVSTNIHWLSDVLAGALIGTVIGLCCAAYRRSPLTAKQ